MRLLRLCTRYRALVTVQDCPKIEAQIGQDQANYVLYFLYYPHINRVFGDNDYGRRGLFRKRGFLDMFMSKRDALLKGVFVCRQS